MKNKVILKMENITKKFGSNYALNHVTFELHEGEVHILCGENGAGKSTLMKILAGIYQPTEGKMYVAGKEAAFKNTTESENSGIAIIHQELSLCPTITVAENMFLGAEKTKGKIMLDQKAMWKECEELFAELNCKIDPKENLGMLTVAEQQLVQIAKALSHNARILIMDEPFSSLADDESEILFGIMDHLRSEGVGIIYIDHRIENFYKIGDTVTVLRDGTYIDTKPVAALTRDEIISMMVGRDISDIYPKYNEVQKEVMFSVKNLTSDYVNDVSFDVHKGEIFGLGGLVGAGRTEILRAIFGIDKKLGGTIEMEGKECNIRHPWEAIDSHIAYVTEDRKRAGLFIDRSIRFNSSIVVIDKLKKGLKIQTKNERDMVQKQVEKLKIKIANMEDPMTSLSGGNQQKVVLSKWLMMEKIKVLILDEPTKGIDVGAKYEIYKLINDLANQGLGIILVSSDLPELLNLSDRVSVIKNGRVSGMLQKEELTQERVMGLCI